MIDCALALMSGPVANTLATGKAPDRVGNRGFVGSPGAETFTTSDGHISVAANTMGQFAILCRLLGRPELAEPPHVPAGLSNGAFLANAATDALREELAQAFEAARPTRWKRRSTRRAYPPRGSATSTNIFPSSTRKRPASASTASRWRWVRPSAGPTPNLRLAARSEARRRYGRFRGRFQFASPPARGRDNQWQGCAGSISAI